MNYTQTRHKLHLYRTDGTKANTVSIKDSLNMFISGYGSFNEMPVLNNKFLFEGDDPNFGLELYVSDGTKLGTKLLKDINPDTDDSDITSICSNGKIALFYANDGVHGLELWRTDGTEKGTYLYKEFVPGSNGVDSYTNLESNIYQLGSKFFTNGYIISDDSTFTKVGLLDDNGYLAIQIDKNTVVINDNNFYCLDTSLNIKHIETTYSDDPTFYSLIYSKNLNGTIISQYPFADYGYELCKFNTNHYPNFTPKHQKFSLPENSKSGQFVGKLSANDLDSDPLQFQLASNNFYKAYNFYIKSDSLMYNGNTRLTVSDSPVSIIIWVTDSKIGTKDTITVDIINAPTLGTPDIDKASFSVYPNPVNNILQIKLPADEIIEIKIFNELGILIKSIKRENSIDLSSIPDGYYTLIVKTRNSTRSCKIVVKKT